MLDVPGTITGGNGRSGSFGFQRESTCAMDRWTMKGTNSAKKIARIGSTSLPKIHEIGPRWIRVAVGGRASRPSSILYR